MNSDKLKSVGKGALIAGLGAALAYAAQWAGGQDFGPYAPAVTAVLAVLVNAIRKWLESSEE